MSALSVGQLPVSAVGVDIVHIPSFAEQLSQPGSVFRQVFTDREWEYCRSLNSQTTQGSDRPSASLAARWAAKEAVVKAWSSLLVGRPPMIDPDEVNWAEIEVIHDRWKRPLLRFHGTVDSALRQLSQSTDTQLHWSLSLSHDHDMSMAFVHVTVHDSTPHN